MTIPVQQTCAGTERPGLRQKATLLRLTCGAILLLAATACGQVQGIPTPRYQPGGARSELHTPPSLAIPATTFQAGLSSPGPAAGRA